jgi:hypothetical protein
MPPRSLADPLYERLRRSLPADQPYTPADWDVDAMPDPVHHYLVHLLRHHRQREARRLRRARTEWVDYEHPALEQATRSFLDTVENHLQVPAAEWLDTLHTATQRTTSHLVRPVPTLTSFVFEDASGAVAVDQIEWRMQFFEPYAYLRNAVAAFAEKRNRDALDRDVFDRLLRRVDERMTSDFSPDRWVQLLAPLFNTARCATGQAQVPLPLLRTFFEEKNATAPADRLATYERNEQVEAVDRDTLRRLLDAASSTTPDPHSPSAPASDEPSLPPDLQENGESASRTDSAPSPAPRSDETEGTGATPMWKQFEEDTSRRHKETSGNDTSQPLWTQFQAQSDHSDPSPESSSDASPASSSSPPSSSDRSATVSDADLDALERSVFSSEHSPNRTVYLRELFGGDEAAYRQILERLQEIDSWSTASQIIASDVFREHQVNIYSDAAVHFTNAVEAGFKKG